MIEIPEAWTLARQLNETIAGKTITKALAGASHHNFAFYSGDPACYSAILQGRTLQKAVCSGGYIEIHVGDWVLAFHDGVNLRFHSASDRIPPKHQLLLEFMDGTALVCTVQMYGGLLCFPEGTNDEYYYLVAKEKPSPLSDKFDEAYFASLFQDKTEKLSAKAFLATEQRIPGLGNGCLQDILWKAKIHPKRKVSTFSKEETERLYQSVKDTLVEMAEGGGRDTEKDLFGNKGSYLTSMSKNNIDGFCPCCGDSIRRFAYLGGNVYICETCQRL